MIAYIKGKITYKTASYIYLDVGGLAYHVDISLHTFSQIEAKNEVKLFTHLHIKEDGHFLYGFYEENERDLFKLLISVSGIGPSTAQVVLSTLNPNEIYTAIFTENDSSFKIVKGIGAKTAKRIILDLKDKIKKLDFNSSQLGSSVGNTIRMEVLSALKGLGINRAKSEPLVNKILQDNPGLDQLEDVLKLVLKQLS